MPFVIYIDPTGGGTLLQLLLGGTAGFVVIRTLLWGWIREHILHRRVPDDEI